MLHPRAYSTVSLAGVSAWITVNFLTGVYPQHGKGQQMNATCDRGLGRASWGTRSPLLPLPVAPWGLTVLLAQSRLMGIDGGVFPIQGRSKLTGVCILELIPGRSGPHLPPADHLLYPGAPLRYL